LSEACECYTRIYTVSEIWR